MSSKSGVSKPLVVVVIVGIAVVAAIAGFMLMSPTGQAPVMPPVEPPQTQEFTINQPLGSAFPDNELNFQPADLTISVGDTVNFENGDENIHTATAGTVADGPSGLFDSETLEAGDVFSFTFTEGGEIQYYCKFHPWMGGTITVRG